MTQKVLIFGSYLSSVIPWKNHKATKNFIAKTERNLNESVLLK
jgi:hypothetical protein